MLSPVLSYNLQNLLNQEIRALKDGLPKPRIRRGRYRSSLARKLIMQVTRGALVDNRVSCLAGSREGGDPNIDSCQTGINPKWVLVLVSPNHYGARTPRHLSSRDPRRALINASQCAHNTIIHSKRRCQATRKTKKFKLPKSDTFGRERVTTNAPPTQCTMLGAQCTMQAQSGSREGGCGKDPRFVRPETIVPH